jgi:hypothetical protein
MSIVIQLLRPDDLIDLTFEGLNLRLDTSRRDAPQLVRDDAAQDAYLIAVFPAQSFAEETLREVDPPGVSDPTKAPGDYQSRLSGPSRLAFRVPAGTEIPFSVEGLLDWSALEPSLAPVAAIRGQPILAPARAPQVVRPAATHTAIELPYRVHLSPGPDGRWRHTAKPITANGRTVLWNTRLVQLAPDRSVVELGGERTAPIRAIYSPDFDLASPPPPLKPGEFPMALWPYPRHALVRMTSTFSAPLSQRSDLGTPAQARRLVLTSLGGLLDAHGSWPDGPPQFSFVGWTHHATLGRDHYVRVALKGRLFPLMNRTTMEVITERRFEPHGGVPVACLRQYVKLLIDEREVDYEGQPFVHNGREMPLARVRINVDETPKIENPLTPGSLAKPITFGGVATSSFEVKLGNAFWMFPCTGVIRDGSTIDFSIGMIFVPEEDLLTGRLTAIADYYRSLPPASTLAPTNSARIKLADFESPGETTSFVTTGFRFDAEIGRGGAGFLPRVSRIEVRVPALEQLTGSAQPTSIRFTDSFLLNGFDPAAGLFAQVADADLNVAFAADQAGGIVRPDLSVRGFTRRFGPVAGDLTNVTAGRFDPATAFGSLDAKLFGALPIKDIVGSKDLAEGAPHITTEPDPVSPQHIVTRLRWKTRTENKTIGAVAYTQTPGVTNLEITVAVRRSLAAAGAAPPAETRIDGTLNDFHVELMEVVRIGFAQFRFASGTGRATEVEVRLADGDPIEFKGALAFVRKIADLLPPGIFGKNGPRIVLRPDAIEVGFGIALPPAAIGVFSLRNIAVSTALTLPFLTGRPSIAVAFASREKPFQLSVLILGGGGFVRVELDTEGIRAVEVMFEFGGVFALDVGVASGSVHILAGIYIGLKGQASELTGYVRVGGEMSVLFISVSVEFMLSLSYFPGPPRMAKGVAKVTVSVKVAFISVSVSFSVERSFGGGSRHLSIGEAMSAADWALYAEAFG